MKTKSLLLCCAFLIAPAIRAQIIHVPADQPTIQAGIHAADNGDTILVADGTYFENISFRGKAITLASHYLMDGNTSHISNTVINGSQATDPDSAAVVMFTHGEDTTSILYGFTITGGSGMYWDYWGIYGGGGIACSRSGAKIVHNRIVSNSVTAQSLVFGGGIACDTDNGENWVVIENNQVSNNQLNADTYLAAAGGIYVGYNARILGNIIEMNTVTCPDGEASGGGIYLDSEPTLLKEVLFENNVVRNNTVDGQDADGAGAMIRKSGSTFRNNIIEYNVAEASDYGRGAGVYICDNAGEVSMAGNTLSNNTVNSDYHAYGGGIAVWSYHAKVIFHDNVITSNYISGQTACAGAGLLMAYSNNPPSVVITNNTILDNKGDQGESYGGGVALVYGLENPVTFDGNKVAGNGARYGGGIYLQDINNIDITNTLFVNDTAYEYGGAICCGMPPEERGIAPMKSNQYGYWHAANNPPRDEGHPRIINNTFTGNRGEFGGAIFSNYGGAFPVIVNSVFWGNGASLGEDLYQTGSPDLPVYYCDINTNGIIGEWSGEGIIFQDPLFCDESCHISWWDSPCWNAGAGQVEINGEIYIAPDHDFEGEARPGDANPDIGADEDIMWEGVDELQVSGSSLQVYPNPSLGISKIKYQIAKIKSVLLQVYDIHGVVVCTLVNENQCLGEHSVTFDVSGLPSGIYLIRLQSGDAVATKKLVVLSHRISTIGN